MQTHTVQISVHFTRFSPRFVTFEAGTLRRFPRIALKGIEAVQYKYDEKIPLSSLNSLTSISELTMKFEFAAVALALVAPVLASPVPAATASAAPASTACVNAVVSNINKVQNQLVTVNSSVTDFHHHLGDITTLLTVEADTVCLMADIDATTSQIKSCGSFDQPETFTILITAFDLMTPIQQTLANIVAKKPDFDKSILNFASSSFLVKYDLQQLQSKTDSLGAALQAAVIPSLAETVSLTFTQIDSQYSSALAAYA